MEKGHIDQIKILHINAFTYMVCNEHKHNSTCQKQHYLGWLPVEHDIIYLTHKITNKSLNEN